MALPFVFDHTQRTTALSRRHPGASQRSEYTLTNGLLFQDHFIVFGGRGRAR